MKEIIVVGTSYGGLGGCVRLMEGVCYGDATWLYERDSRKAYQVPCCTDAWRAIAKWPHYIDAWERRDHWLICVEEHSEFTSGGPRVLDSHVKHKLNLRLNTKLKQQ